MRQADTLIDIRNFKGGTNTMVDEARMGKQFASSSLNMIQVQDGLWKTRWGFNYYGIEISGENSIDGASEYIKSDGTRELLAVGGTTGKIYACADGGSWSEVSGGTMTPGTPAQFLQIGGSLYIVNGIDPMLRYNGTALAEYAALSVPSNVAITPNVLTAGSYNVFYRITAVNEVGETPGSTTATTTTNKERGTWVVASNEYLSIAWDAVANAERYNVYYSDESGYEVYLGTTTTNSFKDDGSIVPMEAIEVPDDDSTGAPKFSDLELSGNRMWGTKDPDNKYKVYYSGTGQHMGHFSPFYGGGWVNLEKGGRETPVKIVHYRTGKGDPIATVICSTPEGLGSIWQIEMSSMTVGDTNFTVPIVYKVVGSIGTNSLKSVVKARDNIGFGNKRGYFFLRNKEQMFNVLSTDETSQAIRPNWRSLNGNYLDKMCAYYYDGKVFISVAEGNSNDTIIIYDLERGNWNYKWTRGVKTFFEYTDSNNVSHFLAVPTSGSRLYEISENFLGDFGTGFYQLYVSPLIPVSGDKTDILKHKEAIVELGRPKGSATFEVLGIGKDNAFSTVATKTISNFGSNSGIGSDLYSDSLFSDTVDSPTVFTQATTKKAIKKRKKLYAVQFKVSSNTADTDYTILSLQAKGRLLKQRVPSSWLN